MAESVPVRCPDCCREHTWTPPVYPCDCGAPVTPPLLRGGVPTRVKHRTWEGSWVEVSCPACGTVKEWPQPELGCGCGTLLRMPVAPPACAAGACAEEGAEREESAVQPSPDGPQPGSPAAPPVLAAHGTKEPERTRPAFRPVTIRTAQDARTAAAQYLRWLGFTGVKVTEKRPASGVDLRGAGIIAHVDPSTSPTTLRDVETLWLNGLNEEVETACFSLAGYAREARTRADALCVPLFVLDLTGMPQAVNDPADDLIRSVC